MRDYFTIEYSKRPVERSGDGADNQQTGSKWQYFKQLLFLKDIVAPRMSSSSLGSLAFETAEMAATEQYSQHSTGDFESQILHTSDDQESLETITPDLEQPSTSSRPDFLTATPQRNTKQCKGKKKKARIHRSSRQIC